MGLFSNNPVFASLFGKDYALCILLRLETDGFSWTPVALHSSPHGIAVFTKRDVVFQVASDCNLFVNTISHFFSSHEELPNGYFFGFVFGISQIAVDKTFDDFDGESVFHWMFKITQGQMVSTMFEVFFYCKTRGYSSYNSFDINLA